MRTQKIAWTPEEDMTLAAHVLKETRNGTGYSKIFKMVEDKDLLPGRTTGASAFRWSNVLKKQYEAAYEAAKTAGSAQRIDNAIEEVGKAYQEEQQQSNETYEEKVETPQAEVKEEVQLQIEEVNDSDLVALQKLVIKIVSKSNQQNEEIGRLQKEIQCLTKENESLKAEQVQYSQMSEDYEALLRIINKAKELQKVQ